MYFVLLARIFICFIFFCWSESFSRWRIRQYLFCVVKSFRFAFRKCQETKIKKGVGAGENNQIKWFHSTNGKCFVKRCHNPERIDFQRRSSLQGFKNKSHYRKPLPAPNKVLHKNNFCKQICGQLKCRVSKLF